MNRLTMIASVLLVVLAAACVGGGPAPSPSPTPGAPLTTAELRYRLMETFGPVWYCDPDFYPIAVADEADRAIERFGEVEADREAFEVVLTHLGLPFDGDYTADQKLEIYRVWKQLNAIHLEDVGDGSYRFRLSQHAGAGRERGSADDGDDRCARLDHDRAAGARG